MDVLAAGESWAVVAKPSGLAVHRSELVRDRHTLVGAARRVFGPDVAPVHRLDRATSGCLLLSLRPDATAALQAALTVGEKRYLAVVRGHVAPLEPIRYDQPLGSDHGDKDAVTVFSPIAGCDEPRCSLVLATPLTGRFHQIRRHLRDLSHPVLGDSSHGDTRINQWWRAEYGLARLALHNLGLRFTAPDGASVEVTCPLPDDLRSVAVRLPWWGAAVAALPELLTPAVAS
ncbi:MAG: pseudouridine synthase [Myxococcota bacterium]